MPRGLFGRNDLMAALSMSAVEGRADIAILRLQAAYDLQRTYNQSGDPQMAGSVASPQMPDRELNLSVGALPPIFNDWNETALWNLSYNFAGFATSCINRQRKYL
jgi:hypothetical protein